MVNHSVQLLFVFYINDLNKASNVSDPMFANETNIFYSHKNNGEW